MEGDRTQSGHGLKAWSVDGLGLGTRERQLGECKAAGHALLDLASLSPLRAPLSPGTPPDMEGGGGCIHWVSSQFWEEAQRGHLTVAGTHKQQHGWASGRLQGLLQASWVSVHTVPAVSCMPFPSPWG